jgi:DNA-binding LacI/PurR family transcriptional regulator
MPPTMRDVAARAGVSVKTVSRVVNREAHVRPEMTRRVLAAIDELGWVTNPAARALRTGRTGRVGIAVTELRRPYLAMLVESLVHEADRRGLGAAVEPTHGDPHRLARVVGALGQHFDGLVVVGPQRLPEDLVDALSSGSGPSVAVQGGNRADGLDRVDEDVDEAVALVARHLAVMGRARPVLLGADRASLRAGGDVPSDVLRSALEQAGIDRGTVDHVAVRPPASRSTGASAAHEALQLRPDLDALVCVNDEVALGALSTLAARGVVVPDDVAVIGYDALNDGAFSTPSLTTVDPGPDRLARAAVGLLTDRLDSVGRAARVVTTPVRLLRRESTMGAS